MSCVTQNALTGLGFIKQHQTQAVNKEDNSLKCNYDSTAYPYVDVVGGGTTNPFGGICQTLEW